ncbi:hypothetical protein [Streptomyces sp. NPDC002685]|uniref:hypothetical protein n=1 Tax=Streptomyces sp. NPDC002685 TaxID=3154540 RepID=UPI003333A029
MSEAEPARPAPSTPVPQMSRERTGVLIAIAAALVAGSLACGFVAGRATAPAGDDDAATCTSANAAEEQLLDEASEAPTSEPQDAKGKRIAIASNVILQNPDCFSASLRAQAQTAKDEIAARADSQAMSDAVARAAECARPGRWSSLPC